MPPLPTDRHELFAKALADGKSAAAAYRAAGYQCARHKARGHGHRLRTREDIAARINELPTKARGRIAVEQVAEGIRRGAPTLYRPELAELCRRLALLGATDQAMADVLGIDQVTLNRWKTRHTAFSIAIEHGKIRADAEIAESLFNRARGMSVPAVKIPAEIRAALQRDKGVSLAFTSIRHALEQLEARKAVEQDGNARVASRAASASRMTRAQRSASGIRS